MNAWHGSRLCKWLHCTSTCYVIPQRLASSHFVRRKPQAVIMDEEGGESEGADLKRRPFRGKSKAVEYANNRGAVDYTHRKKSLHQVPIITVPKKTAVLRNQGLLKPLNSNTDNFNESIMELEYLDEILRLYIPKNRRESGEVLVEGRRLILDALDAGCQLRKLFYTKDSEIEQMNVEESKKVKVGQSFWRRASKMIGAPGTMAIVKIPSHDEITTNWVESLPLIVILDQIKDPGNLGSVLRSLAAVQCMKVLLASQCCDPWDWKVLRGSMGANFRVPITSHIPIYNIKSHLPSQFQLFVASHSSSFTPESMKVENMWDIKVNPEIASVLLVGGETLGLGPGAKQFALDNNAIGIHIDMAKQIDCLNITTAVSLIAYEFKRQIRSGLPL